MTKTQKTFCYEIELNRPMFPRYIFDAMTLTGNFNGHLLSVKDLQDDGHYHGATYQGRDEDEPQESMTLSQMREHYFELFRDSKPDTPECAALSWILGLLYQDWVPGNLGMVDSYVKEFIIALDAFRAHMERIGKFAEE